MSQAGVVVHRWQVSNADTHGGILGVDSYETYLKLLLDEEDVLIRLIDLSKAQRREILSSNGENLDQANEDVETGLEELAALREKRISTLGRTTPVSIRDREKAFADAPEELKPKIFDTIDRYNDLLMELRTISQANSILLNDRMDLLAGKVEKVKEIIEPKTAYRREDVARGEKGKGPETSSRALVVDRRV